MKKRRIKITKKGDPKRIPIVYAPIIATGDIELYCQRNEYMTEEDAELIKKIRRIVLQCIRARKKKDKSELIDFTQKRLDLAQQLRERLDEVETERTGAGDRFEARKFLERDSLCYWRKKGVKILEFIELS